MLLRVLVSLSVLIPAAVSNQCSSRSNGCSIPFKLPYLYEARFTPSCDKHDVCYSCALMYGETQRTCDSKFYSDTRQSCSSITNIFQRASCKIVAFDYFAAVSGGGRYYFNHDSAPSW